MKPVTPAHISRFYPAFILLLGIEAVENFTALSLLYGYHKPLSAFLIEILVPVLLGTGKLIAALMLLVRDIRAVGYCFALVFWAFSAGLDLYLFSLLPLYQIIPSLLLHSILLAACFKALKFHSSNPGT